MLMLQKSEVLLNFVHFRINLPANSKNNWYKNTSWDSLRYGKESKCKNSMSASSHMIFPKPCKKHWIIKSSWETIYKSPAICRHTKWHKAFLSCQHSAQHYTWWKKNLQWFKKKKIQWPTSFSQHSVLLRMIDSKKKIEPKVDNKILIDSPNHTQANKPSSVNQPFDRRWTDLDLNCPPSQKTRRTNTKTVQCCKPIVECLQKRKFLQPKFTFCTCPMDMLVIIVSKNHSFHLPHQ